MRGACTWLLLNSPEEDAFVSGGYTDWLCVQYEVPLWRSLKGADKHGCTSHSPGSLLNVQIPGHTPRDSDSGGLR